MPSCQSPPEGTHCDASEDSGGVTAVSLASRGIVRVELVVERCRGPDKADTGDR